MHAEISAASLQCPDVFCWTKMGSEAGQSLDSILRRKELERLAGNGVFTWGIGNSVGPALEYARRVLRLDQVETLFTAMKSAAKAIDVSPESLVMWTAYIDGHGQTTRLPQHMLVTSRQHSPSGQEKRSHFALMCKSSEPLPGQKLGIAVSAVDVRNLISGERVGASQVTAVVRRDQDKRPEDTSDYSVLFKARLTDRWFVKLVEPVVICGDLERLYRQAVAATDAVRWARAVNEMHRVANEILGDRHDEVFLELFATS